MVLPDERKDSPGGFASRDGGGSLMRQKEPEKNRKGGRECRVLKMLV